MRRMKVGLTRAAGLAAAILLVGCSASTEDVRITFCKDLLANMQPEGVEVSWAEPQVTIQRPSHAITRVRLEGAVPVAAQRPTEAACWFAFERREQMPSAVARPLEEYRTLPYAMTIDGRELSDAELKGVINAEQKRRGKALIDSLQRGATGVAEQVRAGIGG